MINILFQSYGSRQIADEVIYSVLSFVNVTADKSNFRIVIYTDNKDYFSRFLNHSMVSYRIMSSNELKQWKGQFDFIHRVKIEVIRDCFQKFDGHILYCDSDTIFTKDANELVPHISPEASVMHVNEGFLNRPINPIFVKMGKFLRKNEFDFAGVKLKIPVNTPMWNAGVLGIHRSNNHLIDEVLQLNDIMFMVYQKHVIEQLAFSYILNKRTTVRKAANHIFHYWHDKLTYREAIDRYLYDKDDTLWDAIESKKMDPSLKIVEKVVKKGFFRTLIGK